LGEEVRSTIEPWAAWRKLTGTTTNAYVDAMDWITQAMSRKSILLKNTHALNGLHYKLLTQMSLAVSKDTQDPVQDEKVAETVLAAGEVAEFLYNRSYARMILQVKAEVADSQATYRIDRLGEGI